MATKESKEAKDETAAAHFALLEQMDLISTPKPFRNPQWRANQRRNKNIKMILGEASRREAASASAAATPAENNSGAATPVNGNNEQADQDVEMTTDGASAAGQPNLAQASRSLSKLVLKNLAKATNGIAPNAPSVTYTNIESAPSLAPQKRYCDITGLPATYTDPKSRLRYHDKEVFSLIRGLPQGVAEQFLEARNAHVILK